jgi:TonB family protein
LNRTVKWAAFSLPCLLTLAAPWAGAGGKNPKSHALMPSGVVILSEREASHLLLDCTKPEYPPIAKVNYIQGKVNLQIVIDKDGKVTQVHVLDGFPLLAAAALKGVRKWKYRPLVINNAPAPFQTAARVSYYLKLQRLIPLPSFIRDPVNIPMQPDKDFERQVRPPQILAKGDGNTSGPVVEMELLLDDDGSVLDNQLLRGTDADFERAQEKLKTWKFQPAHWGSLAIPWTLEVSVPVGQAPAH